MLGHGEHEGMLERTKTWLHRLDVFAEFSRLDGQQYQPGMVANDTLHELMALRIALPLYGRVKGMHLVAIHLHTTSFHRLDKESIKATEGVLKDRIVLETTHIWKTVPFVLHRGDVIDETTDIGDVGVDIPPDI